MNSEVHNFFKNMEQSLPFAKKAGFFCDPWAVANLKRDEVLGIQPSWHGGLIQEVLMGLMIHFFPIFFKK